MNNFAADGPNGYILCRKSPQYCVPQITRQGGAMREPSGTRLTGRKDQAEVAPFHGAFSPPLEFVMFKHDLGDGMCRGTMTPHPAQGQRIAIVAPTFVHGRAFFSAWHAPEETDCLATHANKRKTLPHGFLFLCRQGRKLLRRADFPGSARPCFRRGEHAIGAYLVMRHDVTIDPMQALLVRCEGWMHAWSGTPCHHPPHEQKRPEDTRGDHNLFLIIFGGTEQRPRGPCTARDHPPIGDRPGSVPRKGCRGADSVGC